MGEQSKMTVADVRRMLNGEDIQSQAANTEPVTPTLPAPQDVPPVTIETVKEAEMQTVETVQTVDADEGMPSFDADEVTESKPKSKSKKGKVTPKPVNWNS